MKLKLQDISFRYHKKSKSVLNGISLDLMAGTFWSVIGPNGSGKSTFLKLISGLLDDGVCQGKVLWDEIDLHQMDRIELAQNIAFVPGSLRTEYPISVYDFVLQGRYSRSPYWRKPSALDRTITESALQKTGIAVDPKARINEISAGEMQLTLIARALAQEPKVLLLDETLANLDLFYQRRIFELLTELNRSGKMLVIVAIHDLNLALEFTENSIWFNKGAVLNYGKTKDTLNEELLDTLYNTSGKIVLGENPFSKKPKVFWT